MKTITYTPKGVCSRQMEIDLEDDIIKEVDANDGPGKHRPAYLNEVKDNPLAAYQGLPFNLPFKVGRNK